MFLAHVQKCSPGAVSGVLFFAYASLSSSSVCCAAVALQKIRAVRLLHVVIEPAEAAIENRGQFVVVAGEKIDVLGRSRIGGAGDDDVAELPQRQKIVPCELLRDCSSGPR